MTHQDSSPPYNDSEIQALYFMALLSPHRASILASKVKDAERSHRGFYLTQSRVVHIFAHCTVVRSYLVGRSHLTTRRLAGKYSLLSALGGEETWIWVSTPQVYHSSQFWNDLVKIQDDAMEKTWE